jgi:lipopolysaccharide export system protein LptA
MVTSTLKVLLTAAIVWTAPLGAAETNAPHLFSKPSAHEAIDFSAQPVDIDYKNKTISAHKVRISQGNLVLTADLGLANGTGVENAFDNSHWVFRGAVKITMEGAVLNADEAQVTFKDKLLMMAQASGKPANFQQRLVKGDKLAQGHATNIDYDVAKGVVRLNNNAWLSDGPNEMRGESLKYDIVQQTIRGEASEQNNQRVHIIITPPPPKSQTPPPP